MEAYPWNIGASREELNLMVGSIGPEREHECDVSPSSKTYELQLVRAKMRAADTSEQQKHELQISGATNFDGTSLSITLCNILKGVLSRASCEGLVSEFEDVLDPASNTNLGNDLTQEERRAERNRKGRARSLRTRLRNAAHIKTLESACSRLARENKILRDLVNCLKRGPPAEERLISIFRSILLSAPGLSSVLHPTAGRFGHSPLPSCSVTSLTCPEGSSNHEEISNNQAGSSTGQRKSQISSETRTDNEPHCTQHVPESNAESSWWKAGQAEVSNASKTSMTTRRRAINTEASESGTCAHGHHHSANEVLEQDRSVFVKFTLEDINNCLSMPWKG